MDSILKNNPKGSIWHRWDPHIHTPETVLNDQYKGTDPWDDFFSRVEKSSPKIKALGITDYYSIATYEKVVEGKKNGRLPEVDLIFANIELRFSTGTARDAAINGHLLVSPEDHNHVDEAKRFLQNLEYSVGIEKFRCQRADLIRLGRFHNKTITDDLAALEVGTNQFKVTFSQMEGAFKDSAWARKNILFAVSGNSGDGTSGLNNDASFSSMRQHIERTAQIIFAASDKQRGFWLGKGVDSIEQIIEKFHSCKPCIHGSDAHTNEKVGKPDQDRYTWIKGDIAFESLRQICIEPDRRVFIGVSPPNNQISSNIIESISTTNADWISPSSIQLNSGLIAIIGARGSGKTALADLIAVGGTAISSQLNATSFINRAREYLTTVSVELNWQTGTPTSQTINQIEFEELWDIPRVQYLSQQFVDKLCSAEGITDELMNEIERVIFIAHPSEDRLGISNFQEFLSIRSSVSRQERSNQQEIIDACSKDITDERIKWNSLVGLKKKKDEKAALIKTDKENRQKLLSATGNSSHMTDFQNVSVALDRLNIRLDQANKKKQSLIQLKQAVSQAKASTFPDYTQKLKTQYVHTGLDTEEWKSFDVDFKMDVVSIVDKHLLATENLIRNLKGILIVSGSYNTVSLIPTGTDLANATYELLSKELDRLKYLIGIDNENGKQFTRINEKLVKDEADLEKLAKEIEDAEDAQKRIKILVGKRQNAYSNLFEAIIEEEGQLFNLYQPLMATLGQQKGSLSKLTFQVQRLANTNDWAAIGEGLLDLRKNGPFKGKGTLLSHTNQELKRIWETGCAEQISTAISNFRARHEQAILEHAPVEKTNYSEYSEWLNRISNWLYSTDHISVNYGIQYDNVDIRQLSPGTRGIVLLLLYLAIDKEDDRPLIIDQPEENLDPKSIFDELVPLFREVKSRRQIIIVTHNANLVVNTDADQVIIASCGAHRPNQLPQITYLSGGLENPTIRQNVCSILEGGEKAFMERAKRLRVTI